jgi:hypothetical protein
MEVKPFASFSMQPKTITVTHNFRQKMDEMNKQIVEYSEGEIQPKTFPVVQMKFGWNES